MLSRPAWSLGILFNVCHALTLFPPPPPVSLGTPQRVTWNSIPGDPPFFNLSFKCFGTPAFENKNCTTSKGEASIVLPGGFEISVTVPCYLLALSLDTGQLITPEVDFDLILNDPTTRDLPGTKTFTTTAIPQTHSPVHATPAAPPPQTSKEGGGVSRENTTSTASQNAPSEPPDIISATSITSPQSPNNITDALSTPGTLVSSTPQASFTLSSTSTGQTQDQTSSSPLVTAQKVLPVGAIVGGSIAGFLVLGISLLATWLLCTRRQRRRFAPLVPVPLAYDAEYAQPMSSRVNRSVRETLVEKAERQRQDAMQNTPTSNPEFSESVTIMPEGRQEAGLRTMVQHMSERIQALEASQQGRPETQVWLHPSDLLNHHPPPNYSDDGYGKLSSSSRLLSLIPGLPIESTPSPVRSRKSLSGTIMDPIPAEHYASTQRTYDDNLD